MIRIATKFNPATIKAIIGVYFKYTKYPLAFNTNKTIVDKHNIMFKISKANIAIFENDQELFFTNTNSPF